MSADSRLSAVTVDLELVSKDGPRSLWQRAHIGYTAICTDCDVMIPFRHRLDAENWLDGHDCEDGS